MMVVQAASATVQPPPPLKQRPGSPSAAMHEGIRRPFADGPSAGRDGGSCDDNDCNSEDGRASTIRYSDDEATQPKIVLRNDTLPPESEEESRDAGENNFEGRLEGVEAAPLQMNRGWLVFGCQAISHRGVRSITLG